MDVDTQTVLSLFIYFPHTNTILVSGGSGEEVGGLVLVVFCHHRGVKMGGTIQSSGPEIDPCLLLTSL